MTIEATEPAIPRMTNRWFQHARSIAGQRTTLIAGVIFLSVIAYCALWPAVAPYGANDVEFSRNVEGPSLSHPLGTDRFGRDLFTRLAEGGRTSLAITALALGVILMIGVIYGTIAAVAGGKVDAAMMRLLDGLFAIPRLPVAIVILVALRLDAQNVQTIAFALSIMGWMLTARLVRGQVLAVKSREHVRAARAIGAGWAHVARRHLIPNSAGIILIAVLLELPTVVLGEAFLAVLGLGPDPPTATWGNIAQDGLHFGRLWEMFVPSAVIAVFALSANVLVDGIHDALDPRRR
ncbi:MAG: oligopeptide transport system permease protein [Gaiellales bacterium]|nr:oligopeptide transport system permease protein [Gaiellales bacterium]